MRDIDFLDVIYYNKIMKNNRLFSFIIVTLVYVVATAIGIWTYNNCDFTLPIALLVADVSATVVTFAFSLIFKNASIYDPYWSVQPIVIVVCYALNGGVNLYGALILFVICLWGIRLTLNWAYTFQNLNHEDWRYRMLKEKTGAFYPIINFLGIHLVPTLVVYACVLPAVFVLNSTATLNVWSAIFLVVSLCAVVLQGVSDYEMHKFRKTRPTNFIRTGLWKYSRHPNYLGEILMWWGIGLSAVFSIGGAYYLITGAVLNTLLFAFVSIPMADKRQSKKEGFAEYKSQTRALLPIKK